MKGLFAAPWQESDRVVIAITILIICALTFLALIKHFSLADYWLINGGGGSAPLGAPLMPLQPTQQVYNPFSLILIRSSQASLTEGATVMLTSHVPCWLGVYGGVEVSPLYPAMHSPWSSIGNLHAFREKLAGISQFEQHFEFPEGVEGRELRVTWPTGALRLGAPPRDRYPLTLVLLDVQLVGAPHVEALQAHQIALMVSLVHLRDEVCAADSHVFAQFVRTPLGPPHDLKQLYVSEADDISHSDDNPTSRPSAASGPSSALSGECSATSAPPSAECAGGGRTLCTVCQSASVERALLPCRHACVCGECAARLLHCPMCRAFIISSLQLVTS